MNAARKALLTDLGVALGCEAPPTPAQGLRLVRKTAAGLPAECYFSGPIAELGPASRRIPQICGNSMMDREARELALRGEEELLRFFQKLAIARRRAKGARA